MIRIYLLVIISILYCNNSNAQNLILVQNGSVASVYPNIQSAVDAANNGDTIYIPGGTFSEDISISKKVCIIGTGHNADSTKPFIPTNLGSITVNADAGGGSFIGFYINNIVFQSISTFTISRCKIYILTINGIVTDLLSTENIIDNIRVISNGIISNSNFYNNIIAGQNYNNYVSQTFRKTNLFNNIFLGNTGRCGYQCYAYPISTDDCLLENNIFIFSNNTDGFGAIFNNSVLYNNLIVLNQVFNGSNNISNQALNSIFKNQSGNEFSYGHDYHLKDTSPGKNAGIDGQDVGIYGGLFPWKDGSLPANPQVLFRQIAGTTDQNGNLKINIKVKAQNN